MENRYAVMDLGTNTFHLLIAEGIITDFRTIVHEHIAVKIGEGGINNGTITPAAFQRGLDTMKSFAKLIEANNVRKTRCVATSALRNASNGRDFIDQVKAETGIGIDLIDGGKEAALIYEDIKAAEATSSANSLIMDIAGGSIEFIIGNNEQMIWKQSFEIGAARLMERFHHTEPISPASVEALDHYLEDTLQPLFDAVKENPVHQLIGSSGSFETFAELAARRRDDNFDLEKVKNYVFDYEDLLYVTDEMIVSNHMEREANELIIPVRTDMIVVSSVVTRFILSRLDIRNVSLCTYSLKEGVLAEMMEDNI
ncbi:MAG TPA: exopolyphosphatase [Mucilaginibacter sp.]|nr:exopolyphosphatase [Mucilaginibacter sp.]